MAVILAAANANAKGPSKPVRILAFGDSLTAGYQLPPAQSYPAQLEKLLRAQGFTATVVNAGVSGDTTSQALNRTEWVLKQGPFDMVLLCLGANDGLRMTPVDVTEKNLRVLVRGFRKAGVKTVVLLGIRLPTNLDPNYRTRFERMYREIARGEKAPFLPFLLEGVATEQMLNLEDQIHPNAEGYKIVARNVMNLIAPLLPH